MADLTFFIGALVPLFLFSRLMLWALGRFLAKGALLALIANGASLAIGSLLLWSSGNFSNIWIDVAAQSVWLTVDLIRFKARPADVR